MKDEPIDGRIDQYALGLVFFEMLTGAVAIGGKNLTQILMHQLQTLVPPLAWVDPELANPAIDAFIARACAKDRAERFPSMAEFIVALQGLQLDERGWPLPKAPPADPGSSTAQTREGPAQPKETAMDGESDTLVRVPVQTELERRLEVPTDPEREPVGRRPPEVKVNPRHAPEPPTDPERPMVVRREAARRTVRGTVAPPKPPSRLRWWLLGLGVGLASLAAAGAWWFTH